MHQNLRGQTTRADSLLNLLNILPSGLSPKSPAVLASYDLKCCMTGLAIPELLVASHIVPWSADEKNRLNPRNGLCLSSLHDRAFDAGLITVTEKHVVKVSGRLKKAKPNWLNSRALCDLDGKPIQLPDRFYPDPEFLGYHQKNVFVDGKGNA